MPSTISFDLSVIGVSLNARGPSENIGVSSEPLQRIVLAMQFSVIVMIE